MTGIGDLGWSPDGTFLDLPFGHGRLFINLPKGYSSSRLEDSADFNSPWVRRTVLPALVARRALHRCAPSWSGDLADLRCSHHEVDRIGQDCRRFPYLVEGLEVDLL
jgi:hypothetical protein